jgi:signal transduction histidine kinase
MQFLDIRTIAFISFIESLLLGFIFIFYSRVKKRYPGTFELGLCLIILSAGFILMSLQKISHDYLSYGLSNILLVAGCCLTPYGFRKFFSLPSRAYYYIGLSVLTSAMIAYTVVVTWNPLLRVIIVWGSYTVIFFESFYILFFRSDKAVKTIARAASTIYFCLGMLFALRFIMAFISPELSAEGFMSASTPGQKGTAALIMIFCAVGVISAYTFFIMMVAFRLEAEVKESEKKAGEYIFQLEEMNNARSKFYSIISHDLRGPIGGMNELLTTVSKKKGLPADVVEYLKVLRETSENTSALLNNLLQWTKAELGAMEVNPVALNAREITEKIIKLFEIKIKQKNLTVINEIGEDLSVYADPSLFSAIIRNLVSNAVKFSFEGGVVKITGSLDAGNGEAIEGDCKLADVSGKSAVISAAGSGAGRDAAETSMENKTRDKMKNTVLISVIDNGLGIAAQDMEKIFTSQNQPAIKFGTAGESGTGLGLLICREFSALSGGGISVSSEPGHGSVFTLRLPALS